MNKLFLNTILAMAVMNAAPTGNQVPAGSDDRSIIYFRFGAEKGFQKEMAVSFTNTSGVAGEIALEFRDYMGQVIEIPFKNENGGVTRMMGLVKQLKPYEAGVYSTSSTGMPFRHGWLRIVSRPAGAITVVSHARSQADGGSMEHNYTLAAMAGQRVQTVGPFDNGSEDQYLLANNGAGTDQVTLIFRSRDGVEGCRAKIDVQAGRFEKTKISDTLPCAANSRGMIEVRSTTGRTVTALFVLPKAGGTIPLQPAQTAAAPNVEEQLTDLWQRLKKSAGIK